jgi:tetratricopeptide (TPR) repeat protein
MKTKLHSFILALILSLTLSLSLPLASCSKEEAPLTAAELLDLGEKFLLELDYEQAIVYFTTLIEIEPKNARAYIGAAEAYAAIGRTDEAIAILEEGLAQLPDNVDIAAMLEALRPPEPTPTSTETPTTESTPTLTPEETPTVNDGYYEKITITFPENPDLKVTLTNVYASYWYASRDDLGNIKNIAPDAPDYLANQKGGNYGIKIAPNATVMFSRDTEYIAFDFTTDETIPETLAAGVAVPGTYFYRTDSGYSGGEVTISGSVFSDYYVSVTFADESMLTVAGEPPLPIVDQNLINLIEKES